MIKNAKEIDLETYPRANHFRYFKDMQNPFLGFTVNVDITDFLKKTKENGYPFFLSFLYKTVKSANSVPELRRRIYNDKIIEFENCDSSHTVALENGTYCYCRLDCKKPFKEFLLYALSEQKKAAEKGSIDENEDEALSCFFVSTVPWINYTSLIQPTVSGSDSNVRITWGKYAETNGRTFMPVSILCHHALVDGIHISEFYNDLNKNLAEF